jgi:hypothetical protein
MANREQVTYCGLYCGLCAQRNRIPQRAASLRDAMRKEGYENWGKELAHFVEFWSFLNNLADSEVRCSCRAGKCGPPFCGIRKCAQEKGVEVCIYCKEYPCQMILDIARGYVSMLADGQRMKDIGIDTWIKEQEERRKTGFAYCDIRVLPYQVPGGEP